MRRLLLLLCHVLLLGRWLHDGHLSWRLLLPHDLPLPHLLSASSHHLLLRLLTLHLQTLKML